jgi:ElaB/YqjD/DUF883 family membrane-anchored ribosome-binding protein
MINPNGDEFTKDNPLPGSTQPSGDQNLPGTQPRFQEAAAPVSATSEDVWTQTTIHAGSARERTEFFLRENPIPTILGALAVGLAIGLAIRYSSEREPEPEVKSPLGNINVGMLSLPFLWRFFKSVRGKYEDSAEVVKDQVDKLKEIDVDRYVKPLRKKWRSWTN